MFDGACFWQISAFHATSFTHGVDHKIRYELFHQLCRLPINTSIHHSGISYPRVRVPRRDYIQGKPSTLVTGYSEMCLGKIEAETKGKGRNAISERAPFCGCEPLDRWGEMRVREVHTLGSGRMRKRMI